MAVTRRRFLRDAALVGLSVPVATSCAWGREAPPAGPGPFRHGVASGDPESGRVVLWTRVTPAEPERIEVEWRVALDPALERVVARGRTATGLERDYTVKVDAGGLEPGRTYHYGFRALGADSPVGRTRTLPAGAVERVRLGFVSCSNYAFGFFHAYRELARRDDLDAVLHLGDYIYEYANGEYGDGTPLGRTLDPVHEIVSLGDYRARYAQYRSDPDLQEAHRLHPFITVWDDHESANNAWTGGAQNHQPEREGPWSQRKAVAVQAYLEWMPIRDPAPPDGEGRIYRSFRYGDLVDLIMLDTRLVGRDREVAANDAAALADPSRSLLGREQERWLLHRLERSHDQGVTWRVIGQQVMFAQLRTAEGLIRNPDQWDGYPESRRRILEHLRREGIDNVVVLTGDIHSSWAQDVALDPFDPAAYDPASGRGSLAVEFVTPAVTSPGIPERERAASLARSALQRHPHLRWVDLHHQGHAVLELDRERARAEWWHLDDVAAPQARSWRAHAWQTRVGRNHVEPVDD